MARRVAIAAMVMATGSSALPKAAPSRPTKGDDALAVQVLLDRAHFSPGEIDGRGGPNTTRAVEAFERATGQAIAAALARADAATTSYVITADDAAGPFAAIPDDMMAKAALPSLPFASVLELLGERFHSDPALLTRLNPTASFAAGASITVPDVLTPEAEAATPRTDLVVTVSKSRSVLTVADRSGAVLYHAPATTGSEHDPLPIGTWKVQGVARNPPFSYNPDLFWDADRAHSKATLPPGPNGPVGVVWIDLDKPHYGIHGTPEPGAVGHSASHGCVRLTNWDAAAVAALVTPGTKVVFAE